jgi:dipeptidyl aminopeptidase/acylaminoacyl peptidase
MKSSSSVSLLFFLALLCSATRTAKADEPTAPLSVEDALEAKHLSEFAPLTASPDGKWLVYTVRRNKQSTGYDFQRQEFRTGVPEYAEGGDLFVLSMENGKARLLTGGKGNNWLPTWSPDGRYVAFISDRDGSDQARLWIWNVLQNELKRISEINVRAGWYLHGGQLQWTPNSKELLVTTLPANLSTDGYPRTVLSGNESSDDHSAATRRSTATVYRASKDLPDKQATRVSDPWDLNLALRDLAVVDVSSGKANILVSGRRISSFQLSPDGTKVAFAVPERMSAPGSQQILFSLATLALDTLQQDIVASDIRLDYTGGFSWSPESTQLAFVSSGADDQTNNVFIVGARRGSPPHNVTEFNTARADSPRVLQPPLWDRDGIQFYFVRNGSLWQGSSAGKRPIELATVSGRSIWRLIPSAGALLFTMAANRSTVVLTHDDTGKQDGFYRVDLDTGKTAKLLEAGQCYSCAAIDDIAVLQNGAHIVYSAEGAAHASDLWMADNDFQRTRRLTLLNPQFDKYKMGAPKLIQWLDDDGEMRRGSLLLPSDYQEGNCYPLIVIVYGGALLSNAFDEFGFESAAPFNMQVFATRGYAVLLPDAPFQVGTQMLDLVKTVLPGVNKVIEMGVADPARLGIMGHSNGGYSTLALIAQTKRFRVAVELAGLADEVSMYGEMDDSGIAFGTSVTEEGSGSQGGTPWQALYNYIENSPLFHFDRIDTPLLIIHGDSDHTVAPFLGDQVFVSLRRLGKEVEYVKYRGEGHSPSAWSLVNQMDYYRRTIDWFQKYLTRAAR